MNYSSNVVAVSSLCTVLGHIQALNDHSLQSDVMLSFLPLAHMLERCCEVAVYIAGGAVGFYSGDIRNLADDYKTLRPTITPSVPRLLNRVYDKVTTAVNGSAIKKMMLKMAIASKKAELERCVYELSNFFLVEVLMVTRMVISALNID